MDSRSYNYKGSDTRSSSSSSGGYQQDHYRSSTAQNYRKTVTSRNGVIVHQEHARGYSSADPHPPYSSQSSSKRYGK